MYSTSVEHNVTLKNLHAYCYCMLCFRPSLADVECLLIVESHTHLASHSCVVPRTPAHYHHTMYCSPSLQLLHRLTLRALHKLRPPLSPACPCGKQHVSGRCVRIHESVCASLCSVFLSMHGYGCGHTMAPSHQSCLYTDSKLRYLTFMQYLNRNFLLSQKCCYEPHKIEKMND